MAVDGTRHTSTRAPAQPSYVFRGHTAQIHSTRIVRRNTALLTGDADGWIVVWTLETKRPLAVWKAHDGAILATGEWGPQNIITHGRDHTLRIWQLGATALSSLSTTLPAEASVVHRPKPWLLHSVPVNTLNFCSFSMCYDPGSLNARHRDSPSGDGHARPSRSSESIVVAVPARDDKKIELYRFPEEELVAFVPRVEVADTGMVMALKLVHHQPSNNIIVIAGYEGGFTAVHLVPRVVTDPQATRASIPKLAQTIYLSQPHTQPILSLNALPDGTCFFTSSADAVIAAHQMPELPRQNDDEEVVAVTSEPTLSTNEDVSSLRSDLESSSLSATKCIAQGKSSREDGSNAPSEFQEKPDALTEDTPSLSFSKQDVPSNAVKSSSSKPAGLTSLLSSADSGVNTMPPQPFISPPLTVQPAYKMANTKHAGQQSLCVRSDGRLLVTGGWDSRVRVYSAKTLKEMAVLMWHKEGVYAVDFGEVIDAADLEASEVEEPHIGTKSESNDDLKVVRRETGLSRLQRQREQQMQAKHWVVAGAKDGKVSLWEVY